MESNWTFLIGLGIFLLFIILFWIVTRGYAKKQYGTKMWRHWPTKLYYWQAAVLYSAGFTFLTLFLLNWGNILSF